MSWAAAAPATAIAPSALPTLETCRMRASPWNQTGPGGLRVAAEPGANKSPAWRQAGRRVQRDERALWARGAVVDAAGTAAGCKGVVEANEVVDVQGRREGAPIAVCSRVADRKQVVVADEVVDVEAGWAGAAV